MKRRMTLTLPLALLLLTTWSIPPSSGDFLITLEGKLIETDGPWTIAGDALTYTNLEGEIHKIDLEDIDLEGSEETTALRTGKPYVPSGAADERGPERKRGPKAVLYVGWRCDSCDQTRELLDRLDVDYVVKNPEDHRPTAKELRKKVGKRYILPVIDFESEVVIGFRPQEIRRVVRELQHQGKQEAAEEQRKDEQEKNGQGL